MSKAPKPILSWVIFFTVLVFFVTTISLQALAYDQSACPDNGVSFEPGHGCWVYHDTGGNAGKPVPVWYYYPQRFATGARKVIFVMHGSKRNPHDATAVWQRYADQHGGLLIAPEFSRQYYPDATHYNRGNVRDARGNIKPVEDWTLTTIEEIFEYVVREIPQAPRRYSIQGHSAGGQFVQRLALIANNSRLETAVTANPGWYLLPDESFHYSCGIGNLPDRTVDLAKAYADNLVITLGTEDDDPNAPWLNHGSCAEMQGSNRYDRGRFFYDYARSDAASRGLTFNWKLVEVKGVGHEAKEMVEAAKDEILGMYDVQHNSSVLTTIADTTVKANYPRSNYGSRDVLQIDGRSLKTTYLKFDLRGLTKVDAAILNVEVTDPSNGIQKIHEAKSNEWNESTLTFNNQPGRGAFITTIDGGSKGELLVDLSDYVHSRLGKVVTLILSSSDANGLYFKSRESASPPEIEIFN